MIRYLTEKEVILINALVIRRYSPKEQIGVKLPELLNSAVYRPQQSLFENEAYPTIWLKAAALFESLAKKHSFHNANKRTAFASMKQFLWLNGYTLTASETEAEDFTVHIVVTKPSIPLQQIADWIEGNSIGRKKES
ncbi:MAG TPA: type II toxin-antitoxin system death-on-curing family toxin [Bacillus bacterium]|nr:type II toxin-antitoxin system death-on-curing family toxin [Bacillus sp. (in: firmicutes)]